MLNYKKGFTLLELLIVITILAILTLVVVLFINPVEILKKSRDVQRMSDLDVLRTAINLYLQDSASNSLGGVSHCATANISEPQTAATSNIGTSLTVAVAGGKTLTNNPPALGTTVYNASTSDDVAKTDGTGWVPSMNFTTVSSGPPISKLPVDPINTATTGIAGIDSLYYRYACKTNNTFELDATLESDAFGPGSTDDNKASKDGGNSVMRYEVGTDLNILPSSAPTE